MKTKFRKLMVMMMIATFALAACQPKVSTSLENTTLMACEESIMTQAGDYTSALRKASKFYITDNRLHLLDENGNSLAIFEAQSQELAGTSWLATFVNTESSDGAVTSSSIQAAQQTMLFSNDSKISGNAGCNNYFANYEVEGNKLSLSAIGSTKMFCGEGLMAEETAFLTALEKASSYRISGDSLQIFAADDTTLISFSRTE